MTSGNDIFYFNSPIGAIGISADEGRISRIFYVGGSRAESENVPAVIALAKKQLEEYFKGARKSFELPIYQKGTPFQRAVWNELIKIPYGETVTYGEIAARVGNPRASRAVGMANNKNPIMIVVPCHRVIGKNGRLTGYAGGLDVKAALLELERQNQSVTSRKIMD